MKTIIVVAFIGLLGYTFCADVDTTTLDSSGCPDVKNWVMQDFKPDQFFTGTWYLTHLKHRNHSSVCPKFDLKPTPPTIDYTYGVLAYPGMTFNMHCDSGTKKTGDVYTPFTCKGDFNYNLFMAPVATDYETYGLVYVCQKTPTLGENVFVFNRKSTTEIPNEVKNPLKQKLEESDDSLTSLDCKRT